MFQQIGKLDKQSENWRGSKSILMGFSRAKKLVNRVGMQSPLNCKIQENFQGVHSFGSLSRKRV